VSDPLESTLSLLSSVLHDAARPDLQARIDAARVRLQRPTTVVCVVGEFKQGKSSLVNGLVGHSVCPVDDDIATSAVTLVQYGEEPDAIVRYRGDADPAAERIPVEAVADYVTERQRTAGMPLVDRVDVSVPSSMLADGLSVVDTPGMGGLGAGHAAATLSFLPFADGLLFVSDASSELTAPELEFLERAHALCPNVLVVMTKIDICPAWRRIEEIDRGHMATRGLDLPTVAVSSTMRDLAFERRERELNDRSGFPELITQLSTRVIEPAQAGAADRARTEAAALIDGLAAALGIERDALNDPDARQALAEAAADATERLTALQAGSARWNVTLGDRVADLSSDINHRFRGVMRSTTQQFDERIEQLKTAEEWDELSRELQTSVADAVTTVFVSIEHGRADIRMEIAESLRADEVLAPAEGNRSSMLDVTSFWKARGLDEKTQASGLLKSGLTGLRGAQSGVMLFGICGQFLPAAGAVLIASNPVLLGAGALFGSMQLIDDRKRKVQTRRQAARAQMRQFTDEVQFEMSNELTGALRSVQRDLRDEFVDLISELKQTWAVAAQQAEAAHREGEEGVEARLNEIASLTTRLDGVYTALATAS